MLKTNVIDHITKITTNFDNHARTDKIEKPITGTDLSLI